MMQRSLLVVLVFAALAGTAVAGEVRVRGTEVLEYREGEVMVRGDIDVRRLSHRWLHVYFQVRIGDDPLKVGGKDLLKKWGELFTPQDTWVPVRWSDLRIGLTFEELAQATNLPRGKRSVLWIVCDVWDPKEGKYVGAGWAERAPLIVDVDEAGKITGCEFFNTRPHEMPDVSSEDSLTGKVARLDLRHLKLKKRTTITRTVGDKEDVHDWLYRTETRERADGVFITTEYLCALEELDRGAFFEPIETAEQATELVALGHGKAVVVPDRAAWSRILAHVREKGFTKAILAESPPGTGLVTTEVPGLGWRVRGLLFETEGLNTKPEGFVIYVDYTVSRSGRMGFQATPCIDTGLDVLLGIEGAAAWPRLPAVISVTEEDATVPGRKWN